ncbi:transglutaminase-like putative cysteine protease [Luteimonas cucumeris]|uniref:Transglutaminase-like putative cysteine protease n=1 Tax=Luteimonas cucumeris TaxID=985012 RepID=A0A562L7H4_9GAMM|nr:transglutaminase-like putative cysteine protease [Luteimonas cucumeris]
MSMLLDAATRRWALLATAACLLPLLLQLPPTLAAVIAALAVSVALLSWRQPLPGWLRFLLALTVVAIVLVMSHFSIGRDTGCALLAAMLAIKPSETTGLRDARSLVGFALFAPFATFLLDQGPLSLALSLVGVTLALLALQRFADAESGLPVESSSSWREIGSVWRLIAIGLPLALAGFWLFPRVASPMWGVPERALARPGLSDTMSPGEWVDLMADDTPAMRVRFFGRAPDTSQMYWRGPVLWDFDGRTWSQPRWLRGLPAADVRRTPVLWDYELEFEATDRRQLVALELPIAAPDGAELTIDYGLYAAQPLSTLTRWRMQSAPPLAFEPQLKQLLRQSALHLPDGYNPRSLALARQWRSEAGSDDAAIVQRALRWIRADFAYTLDTPLLGRHAVDEFLFDQQAGFCEHFSSSFVVLMRAARIPARVVTGYVGGYRNPLGDYWVVRRMDAHAWAEVWLPGRGWVRVDPTAAVAPERIYDTLDDRAPGVFGEFAGLRPVWNTGDWLRRGWNDFVLGFDATRQQQMLQAFGIDRLSGWDLAAMFALLAALALGWMAWLIAHRERERDPLLRAWHRLGERYSRHHLQREPHEPAHDWAERVARQRPGDGAALRALALRFTRSRYAVDDDRQQRRDLIRALRAHRP